MRDCVPPPTGTSGRYAAGGVPHTVARDGTAREREDMADWVCARCGASNVEGTATCFSCGAPPGADEAAVPRTDATGQPAAAFATPAGPTLAAPTFEPVVPGAVGLVGGVVGGLVAAIAASAVWYAVVVLSNWQIGLVAVAVGWLVGQGVVFGAEGRPSIVLVAVSAVLTALALAVSEYLIVFHFVSQELEALGAGGALSLIQPFAFMIEVVVESLSADPLTLVFWGIALFEAVVIPYRAMTRPSA